MAAVRDEQNQVKQAILATVVSVEKKCLNSVLVRLESEELRKEFRTICTMFCENADRMLSEAVAGGYKTIRDKLIAHNELRKDGKFHDVKEEKLKYGDERALLKTISGLVTDLELLARNTDVHSVWSSTLAFDQEMVCEFWDLNDASNPAGI